LTNLSREGLPRRSTDVNVPTTALSLCRNVVFVAFLTRSVRISSLLRVSTHGETSSSSIRGK
jgi:hypothetical protein